MIKVYCYSRCTTCKKALKWLNENGINSAEILCIERTALEALLQYERHSLP